MTLREAAIKGGKISGARSRAKAMQTYSKKCRACNADIPYARRHEIDFCNRSCAAKFTNKTSRNRPKATLTSCLNCGVLTQNIKFCGHKCSWLHKKNLFELSFKENNEVTLSITGRKILLEEVKFKCSLCGWGEINLKTNTSPLQIGHIDGNATNNKKSNLRVLCPNCHALTPTFGGLNAGNGRADRRARYKKVGD